MNSSDTYVYVVVNVNGREEPFNVKVTKDQQDKILKDPTFRQHFADNVQQRVMVALKLTGEEKGRFSMMPPQGPQHEKYLQVLKGLGPDVVESTTIDMTSELN